MNHLQTNRTSVTGVQVSPGVRAVNIASILERYARLRELLVGGIRGRLRLITRCLDVRRLPFSVRTRSVSQRATSASSEPISC